MAKKTYNERYMTSPCSPSALKEMALQQLLQIRDKLLTPDSQASINNLAAEQQHEINILISQAQINYLKIKKLQPEQFSMLVERNGNELLNGTEILRTPIHNVTSVEQFMHNASGFVGMIESCFKNHSSSL
ncbi:MAG: hypothetical protein HGB01_12115 [Chlorobiaceae bacterium]|nr:hypothetical protein [Chlorobiaceae bacterium]